MFSVNSDTAVITIYQDKIPVLCAVDWYAVYNRLMDDCARLRVALNEITGQRWSISVQ